MNDAWLADGLKGRHVLASLVAFFGVMLIANGIFLYYALATFGGGDTSDPYRKGLHYNQVLAEEARQAARGWRASLSYEQDQGRLSLRLSDKAGGALTGLHVDATVERPATDRQDITLTFNETLPGVYAAHTQLAPGQWVVSMSARDPSAPGSALYRLKQRILVAATP
jgi:nitrogen fixation protein FixH